MLLHWLVPGDVLGLASIVRGPTVYRVCAETVRESSVLVWDRHVMLALIDQYPRLLHNALLISVGYLDLYIAAHTALVSHTAKQRLASVLVHLTDAIGSEVPGGIELQVTNEELASAANITLFTASRIMSAMARRTRPHEASRPHHPALAEAPPPPHRLVALAQRHLGGRHVIVG